MGGFGWFVPQFARQVVEQTHLKTLVLSSGGLISRYRAVTLPQKTHGFIVDLFHRGPSNNATITRSPGRALEAAERRPEPG